MKKFWMFITFIIMLVCFFTPAQAQAIDWNTTNQLTVAWDAYDPIAAGTPTNPGDVYKFKVYTMDVNDISNVVMQGISEDTQATLTFENEGFYVVGVSTLRYVDIDLDGTYDPLVDLDTEGMPLVLESPIAWSNNPTYTPAVFGVRHFEPPSPPTGMSPQ